MEDYPNKACPSPTVRDITEPGWREKEKKMNEFYNSLPTREELCCGAPGKLGDGDRGESHEPVMDFYKWWYEIGSGIYKLDTEDNEEHARRVVKEAWEYVMHVALTTENEMADYKSMFEQAVRTLAAIDEALGIGDGGCGDPEQTLFAIAELKASKVGSGDTAVTREMIGAAHDVMLAKGDFVLSAALLERIYLAMQQAAPPTQTPFDTCPTCEALARTVMMDQTGAA